MPRVGRLERRLNLVQVENHPFSRLGRETDACENLLELVVGPPAANVLGRFPDADDVKRILTRMGHSTMRAALICQHATEARDRALADRLDDFIRAERTAAQGTLPGA